MPVIQLQKYVLMSEKISLGGVPETLLVPLFYRAKESEASQPLIRDDKAVEIVKTIDYDFSRCNKWSTQACVVVRTRLFQNVIEKFLVEHPDSVVINLAAGLDNRFSEMDNGKVRWFDLDLPDVIDIRKRYISESDRRSFIASDVLDLSWFDRISPADSVKPVLVVAEGLLPYLPEKEARRLLSALADRFPTCTILLEIFGSFVVGREWCVGEFKHIRPVPKFHWSPRDPYELEHWDERFRTVSVENLFEHYPDQWRAAWHIFQRSESFRNAMGSRVITMDLNHTGADQARTPDRTPLQKIKWDSQPLDAWAASHAKGKMVEIDGEQVHYIEKGEGEPLLLLHGFFYDSFMWESNINTLAKHYHVFAIDLWGFGYSSRTPMEYSYALYVQQVLLFMDKLGIKSASFMGQSMGGGIAIQLAVDHPQRVNKLVLIDAAGMPNTLPLSGKMIKNFPAMGRLMYGMNSNMPRKQGLADFFINDRRMITKQYFDNVTRFHKVRGTLDVFISILQRDFFSTLEDQIKQLGKLGKEILIVWGEKDCGNPLRLGRAMHALLPGSQLVVMEDTKHVPNSEKPEEFNQVALEFLLSDAAEVRKAG